MSNRNANKHDVNSNNNLQKDQTFCLPTGNVQISVQHQHTDCQHSRDTHIHREKNLTQRQLDDVPISGLLATSEAGFHSLGDQTF